MCLFCLVSLTNANSSPEIVNPVHKICEDIPVGTRAFTIIATDPDGDPLTFSLINSIYFKVEEKSGVVSVIGKLDRENADVMNVEVQVTDGLNPIRSNLTIIIYEANDNIPIFDKSSYDVTIPENTIVGTPLVKVNANDRDTSTAGSVQYSIDGVTPADGFNLFNISQTGEIKLKGSLNYTSLSTFYQLRINATDGGGKCYYNETNYNSNIVFVTIAVEDIPDLDPQFIGLPYIKQVEENSPPGTSVFTVSAIDPDTGINDKITYTIESSTVNDLFNISENGVISVSSPIDREAIVDTDNRDTVNLTVKATESQLNIHGYYANTTATVQINIMDVNDNGPKFYTCGVNCVEENHFTGEIIEHSLTWLSPINMTVIDPDELSQTRLTLEGADKDVFSAELQITESVGVVQLLVRQSQNLDFEKKQEMVLEVIATDEEKPGFESTATVTITIKDSNDNSPIFPQNTYKLTVAEHSPVDTTIKTITAGDPDTMDQGKIKYSLLPESILQYFDVNPNNGAIYVTNETLLDREVRSVLSATLQANDTDGNIGTTVLEITVTDINDKPPVINRDSYLVFVEEDGNFDLKIEATDDDEPNTKNSQIQYGIVPSMYSDNFTIDPDSGVLTNVGELDREALDPKLNGRIVLTVTATDKGIPPLSAMVTVEINIEDANDNVPQFQNSSYTFSVKEGETGAYVGSVYATDLDQTTDFNRISFRIINGSFGSFIIRTYSEDGRYRGDITVDPDIELDYESPRKHFILWIEAADLEQSTAEVMVEVNVLDVNDERPEFKPIAPVTVKENTPNGTVGSFTGYDKDGNHSLVYELESIKCRCDGSMTACSSFILDPTGDVRVNPEETLDYEKCDQVVIEAQVVDELTEKGENNSITTGQMVINIEDINDNAPEFQQSDNIFVVVSEIASVGTSVAGVTAVDHDSEENRQITFSVDSVKFEDTNNVTTDMRMLFKAVTTQQTDRYVGIIQTDETLDMTLKGKYLVRVSATDGGGLSNSAVLEIFTVDETHRVELKFTNSEAEVENNRDEIVRALTAATQTMVEIVDIRPEGSVTSRETVNTIIVAYFVFPNGTALTPEEVERMLAVPEHFVQLVQLGLWSVGSAHVVVAISNSLVYILLGIMGGLLIVLVVLATSLACTRRNYRRKLKAAKAKNSASMVAYENQKNGAVVPGTNIYTMEGANPVLNLNIDPAMVLDMDDGSYNVDKVSLSSLDDIHDFSDTTKHTDSVMGEKKRDSPPPMYPEPLDEALAQRGLGKSSNNPQMGFINHAFSTTDL